MRAGLLRHRVKFQTEQPVQDTYGEEIMDWQDFDTVWAAVEDLAGNERYIDASDQVIAEATTRIRIRRRDDLDVTMRIVWKSHTYKILAIVERLMLKREMWIFCKELNPEAAGSV